MANQKPLCIIFLSLLSLSPLFSYTPTAIAHPIPLFSYTPTAIAHPIPHKKLYVDYIFQFGDSLSDTGNLIRDSPTGANNSCGRLPYGQTIHRPTGRSCDGLIMIDYIAKFFRLPLLSPYLNKEANFDHGVNFAVGGATALDAAALAAKNITLSVTNSSLTVQLQWFKSHLHSLCGDNIYACKKKLRNSLVLMGEIGGNDYIFPLAGGKPMEEVYSMVPEVIQATKEAVKEVINYGAMRIVVPGNFPIGCIPFFLSLFESNDPTMYDELKCLKHLNDFVIFHNDRLKEAIKELQQEYPKVAIVYGDYYSGLEWILQNAPLLGFNKDTLQKACCGVIDTKYNVDVTRMCGGEGVPVCANPMERLSWDGIHFTQQAYQYMAYYLLKDIVPSLLKVVHY